LDNFTSFSDYVMVSVPLKGRTSFQTLIFSLKASCDVGHCFKFIGLFLTVRHMLIRDGLLTRPNNNVMDVRNGRPLSEGHLLQQYLLYSDFQEFKTSKVRSILSAGFL